MVIREQIPGVQNAYSVRCVAYEGAAGQPSANAVWNAMDLGREIEGAPVSETIAPGSVATFQQKNLKPLTTYRWYFLARNKLACMKIEKREFSH